MVLATEHEIFVQSILLSCMKRNCEGLVVENLVFWLSVGAEGVLI